MSVHGDGGERQDKALRFRARLAYEIGRIAVGLRTGAKAIVALISLTLVSGAAARPRWLAACGLLVSLLFWSGRARAEAIPFGIAAVVPIAAGPALLLGRAPCTSSACAVPCLSTVLLSAALSSLVLVAGWRRRPSAAFVAASLALTLLGTLAVVVR